MCQPRPGDAFSGAPWPLWRREFHYKGENVGVFEGFGAHFPGPSAFGGLFGEEFGGLGFCHGVGG